MGDEAGRSRKGEAGEFGREEGLEGDEGVGEVEEPSSFGLEFVVCFFVLSLFALCFAFVVVVLVSFVLSVSLFFVSFSSVSLYYSIYIRLAYRVFIFSANYLDHARFSFLIRWGWGKEQRDRESDATSTSKFTISSSWSWTLSRSHPHSRRSQEEKSKVMIVKGH